MSTDPLPAANDSCAVELHAGPAADPAAPPELLIEVPHGATLARHFAATRSRLVSDLPRNLEDFFFVNTDVGAPECATRVAREFVSGGRGEGKALVIRGLVPRTFIDCNRDAGVALQGFHQAGFTPAIPPYVTAAGDREFLGRRYAAYQEVARAAYEQICGAGGRGLILHSYAPRSVGIERVEEDIVEQLHRAYSEELYESWPRRPDVDLISESDQGERLASPKLVEKVRAAYAAIGIQAEENATYRLHPATMGYRHSAEYPGQVLCVEISRALLAEPFDPFAEMRIGEEKVARICAPIVEALLSSR